VRVATIETMKETSVKGSVKEAPMNARTWTLVLLVLLVVVSGCGGGGANPIGISISPFAASLNQGETRSFTASVPVNWAVQEGAAGGSITNTGVYTAPNKSGIFHVIATSQADTSKSAMAQVNIAAVAISLTNTAATIDVGNQFQLIANVTGTVNVAVSWAIQEGTSGGTITSSGVYTAPGVDGTFHVIATSQADSSQKATATVTVASLVVLVSPSSDVLGPLGVRDFIATVNTSLNANVAWSVQEGAAGGAIAAGGQYTAPNQTGSFHVVATSAQDPTRSASSTVHAVSSGFRPAGSMRDGRAGQTATLLKTGKLLVAGGDSCVNSFYYENCPLDSSELYDPTAGTFSSTGALSVPRVFHTATLLPDGKVLVAGGMSASAELYDPAAGTFSNTGGMSVGRDSHTATLLSNGKTLIVGGQNVSGPLSSAEEYDPAKAGFVVRGKMAAARTEHTATLLGNGKVLIVGGSDGFNVLASAELYDPSAGTFSTTGSMLEKRVRHTAALLPNGNVLVAGGSNGNSTLATAEIYDVVSGKFTATFAMMAARDSHVAVSLPNGTVLVAGGISSGTDFIAEFFDPVTAVFIQTGSMGVGRITAAAALLSDGRVLVTGGSSLNSAEIYK
jgi:hypothetical protein